MRRITREKARERGLTKFNTAEPCMRGHLAFRWTASGECDACYRLRRGQPPAPELKRKTR